MRGRLRSQGTRPPPFGLRPGPGIDDPPDSDNVTGDDDGVIDPNISDIQPARAGGAVPRRTARRGGRDLRDMEDTERRTEAHVSERPEAIIAPGQMVRQIMEKTFVSDAQAARRLGLSADELERFYAGELPVTKELAFRLKDATGYTASYWQGFERQYRRRLEKWRGAGAAARPEE